MQPYTCTNGRGGLWANGSRSLQPPTKRALFPLREAPAADLDIQLISCDRCPDVYEIVGRKGEVLGDDEL